MATVRRAGVGDEDALIGLVIGFRDYLGAERPTPIDLAAHLPGLLDDERSVLALALDGGGRPTGYAYWRLFESLWASGLEAHLEDLFVVEAARGAGIGGRLLDFAIAEAREQGARSLGLHTNENNPAQSFYRRSGFRPQTEARWDGGREVYWRRTLDST